MDIDKDKMTLTIRTGEESTEKTRSWQLEVVGVLEPDGAKGYWTQSGIVLRIQDMKMLQKGLQRHDQNPRPRKRATNRSTSRSMT